MKIYTRNGDSGETGVLGAIRVSKSHLVVETCGAIDELNSSIGCAIAEIDRHSITEPDVLKDARLTLVRIQSELFDLGSRVAAAMAESSKVSPADEDQQAIARIESWVDDFDAQLPPLTQFILPGGSPAASQLHLARTICRRAERRLVSLIEAGLEQEIASDLVYLNRLSDLLFVLARFANQCHGSEETAWVAFSARD